MTRLQKNSTLKTVATVTVEKAVKKLKQRTALGEKYNWHFPCGSEQDRQYTVLAAHVGELCELALHLCRLSGVGLPENVKEEAGRFTLR